MTDGASAPVAVGLAVGIAFVVMFSLALNPALLFSGFAAEERALLEKAAENESVMLFLKQYPSARIEITGRDPFIQYDEGGVEIQSNPAIALRYTAMYPIATIAYHVADMNNELVRYQRPTMQLVMGLDGTLYTIELSCSVSYLESFGAVTTLVSGDDNVKALLHEGKLPC